MIFIPDEFECKCSKSRASHAAAFVSGNSGRISEKVRACVGGGCREGGLLGLGYCFDHTDDITGPINMDYLLSYLCF